MLDSRNCYQKNLWLGLVLPAFAVLLASAFQALGMEYRVVDVDVAGAASADPSPFLAVAARYHVALVHFPIAWTWAAALAVAVRHFRREAAGRMHLVLAGLALAGYLPAAVTGWLRHLHLPDEECMDTHKLLALASLALVLVGFVLVFRRHRGGREPGMAGLLLFIGAALLVSAAAHFGGVLVYGASYFKLGG